MTREQKPRINAGTAMGQELYRTDDEYGPIIVYRRGERHIMSFGSVLEQSSVIMSRPWHLVHEYTQIMLLGLVFSEPRHITVLGLGGGGLAHCLQQYYPDSRKTFVELRQAVIDTARAWFELPEAKALKIICADAFSYMQKQKVASTELIMSDLYEAEGMSATQAQVDFIQHCARALTDDGWLVLNFHTLPEETSALMQSLCEHFSELYVCDVYSGNRVMFCGKQAPGEPAELKENARQLGKQTGMSLLYYYQQMRPL